MQIGIRVHDTVQLPIEERLAEIRRQGFTCGHLALNKVIQEFSVKKEALTPGLAMYLKRLFQEQRLDIAVLGCYQNLAHPNQQKLKEILALYEAHIRFASLLGAGVVGTETGAPNEAYEFEPACRSEEAFKTLIHNLRTVVGYAEKFGVVLAIEPVINHIVYDAKRARRVLDEIASPNLQIIFDPVNLIGMENVTCSEEVIEEAMLLLEKEIAVVHIKDFVIENHQLKSVAAGFGALRYDPIIKFIKYKKPYIQVTLENTTPDNAGMAKKMLEDLWARV